MTPSLQLVHAAGGEAFVSSGVSRTIIGLVGDIEQFGALNLRSYAGVADVVRISVPYKLVSREHHPSRSVITVGGVPIGPDTFTVIAGPCTVENAEQTLDAARMAQAAGRRRCCAAARSSRGRRRTPSRASARRDCGSWPTCAPRRACRS